MSYDKKTQFILSFNNVEAKDIERFIGFTEDRYYFMCVIGGKVVKLKIPGLDYSQKESELQVPTKEYLEEKIQELDENIEKITEKDIFTEKLVEEIKDSVDREIFRAVIIDDAKLKEVEEKTLKFITPEKTEIDDFLAEDVVEEKKVKLSNKKIEIIETSEKKKKKKNDDFIDLA